jgi:hypothetical protein
MSTQTATTLSTMVKLGPVVNTNGDGFKSLTMAEWNRFCGSRKGTLTIKATAEHGAYRQRYILAGPENETGALVYITDSTVIDLPPAANEPASMRTRVGGLDLEAGPSCHDVSA